MRSRVRWQRVCWVAARGSSASQKTQADFSLVCWQLSRTRSRRPMSNGTSLPAGLSRSSAPLAALSQGWATRCIRPLILVPPSLLHLPTTRVCGDLTCACLRPLVVSMPRYLAARYHSTAPGSLAQHLLISGCRLSCCAVLPCSRARGLLGHLAEELRHPIAPDIYSAIDRNAVYRPAASNDITEQR